MRDKVAEKDEEKDEEKEGDGSGTLSVIIESPTLMPVF